MAAPAASTSGSSFARLVSRSKVISQYDPSLPLVYTSHGGSFARSDFGLKRALPQLTSAAVRVKHLDSPQTKLTDFEYGSKQLSFLKRWQETGVGVMKQNSKSSYSYSYDDLGIREGAGEQAGACTWDRASFCHVEALKATPSDGQAGEKWKGKASKVSENDSAIHAPSSSTNNTFTPNYLDMSHKAFEAFLHRLRKLRPEYKHFIESRLVHDEYLRSVSGLSIRDVAEPGTSSDDNVLEALRQCAGDVHAAGRYIDTFLASEEDLGIAQDGNQSERIQPMPHIAAGLSYAPSILYQTDVTARAIPARVLDDGHRAGGQSAGNSFGARKYVDVSGQVVDAGQSEIGGTTSTMYRPDYSGVLNPEYGRIQIRIKSANKRPPSAYYDDPDAGTGAPAASTKVSTAEVMPEEETAPIPLQLGIYHAPNPHTSKWRLPGSHIGTQQWVATEPKTPQKSMFDLEGLQDDYFYNSTMNLDSEGNRKVSPPKLGDWLSNPKRGTGRLGSRPNGVADVPLTPDRDPFTALKEMLAKVGESSGSKARASGSTI